MISALKSIRRKEVSAYFDQHYVLQAGIQGWSTVACFNQIVYERDRYSDAIRKQVDTSMASSLGYMNAYAFQSLTLLCGLLAGLFLAVCQVTYATVTPGQFVMLLTYWGQLSGPLAFFAGLGKSISRDLISAEKLLEIMQTKPTVVSKEGALPLDFKGGQVSFDRVGFSYDKKKEILKDVSLEVSPGTTVAFVGPTGAGKSTILKLIDRFYDVTEGSIKIDGQDIRDLELSR
jgi:ABC-type multidrug transport system fused ATPase/permease subunit